MAEIDDASRETAHGVLFVEWGQHRFRVHIYIHLDAAIRTRCGDAAVPDTGRIARRNPEARS